MDDFVQRIDFKKVGERVLATCIENGTDKNRGNYQVNVLFSGGENYDRGTQGRKEAKTMAHLRLDPRT